MKLKAPPSADQDQGPFPHSFREKLLDSLYDGVYFVDRHRRITYWNQGAESLTGYSRKEAVGKCCFDNFLMHVDEGGCSLCLDGCPLAETIRDGQRREAEVYLRHKLGHRVPVNVRVAPIRDAAEQIVGAVEIFSDLSSKKEIERRAQDMENLAFRDALTGLPNRRFMDLKVRQAVEENRELGRAYGLLMVDIDHFKLVNDRFGHNVGDAVLKTVAGTLAHGLRGADIVGRWGGEEFLVILADVTEPKLAQLAKRCRNLIAESAALGHRRIRVTASIGATLIHSGDSWQSAVQRADKLMYQGKTEGRNRAIVG